MDGNGKMRRFDATGRAIEDRDTLTRRRPPQTFREWCAPEHNDKKVTRGDLKMFYMNMREIERHRPWPRRLWRAVWRFLTRPRTVIVATPAPEATLPATGAMPEPVE